MFNDPNPRRRLRLFAVGAGLGGAGQALISRFGGVGFQGLGSNLGGSWTESFRNFSFSFLDASVQLQAT